MRIGDSENNVSIYYKSLYVLPTIVGDDILSEAQGNIDIRIPDEHAEGITDYASYKLLSKVDTDRADFYKINWAVFLERAEFEISKGRSEVTQTDEIREPFFFEGNQPFQPL